MHPQRTSVDEVTVKTEPMKTASCNMHFSNKLFTCIFQLVIVISHNDKSSFLQMVADRLLQYRATACNTLQMAMPGLRVPLLTNKEAEANLK